MYCLSSFTSNFKLHQINFEMTNFTTVDPLTFFTVRQAVLQVEGAVGKDLVAVGAREALRVEVRGHRLQAVLTNGKCYKCAFCRFCRRLDFKVVLEMERFSEWMKMLVIILFNSRPWLSVR